VNRFSKERHLLRMNPSSTSLTPEALLAQADFVRGLARSLVRDPGRAEDVAQATLVRALERPPRSAASLRSWLHAVTRNFARQEVRLTGRRRVHETAAAHQEALPSTADVLEREAIRGEVVQAVLALPESQRTVVLLRFYEGQAPREIARRLGVPVETVRTRLKRGLRGMRRNLDGKRSRNEWLSALLPLAGKGSWTVVLASTTTKLAAAAAVILVGLTWWPLGTPGTPPPPGSTTIAAGDARAPALEEPSRKAEALEPAGTRAAVLAAGTQATVVAGRALTPAGEPLVGERVYLSAAGPIPALGRARSKFAFVHQEQGDLRLTETDDRGGFRFEVDAPGRYHVGLVHVADRRFYTGAGDWVDAPVDDVELVARPAAEATLSLRARMEDTDEEVSGFHGGLWSTTEHTSQSFAEEDAHLEQLVYLPEDSFVEEAFQLAVVHDTPLGKVKATRRIVLRAGERTEVTVFFQPNDTVRGVVVDELDRPVSEALVFFGVQEHLRGDEPFKPYDAARMQKGVRTDDTGAFELAGRGRWVTAWHAELSPQTVAAAEAEHIVLRPRSTVVGTLIDAGGSPLPGATLVMDRQRRTVTDAGGRFRFDGLEAGIRGIQIATADQPRNDLGEGPLFGVHVAPSETVDVELSTGLANVTVELQQEDLPYGLNPKDLAVVVGEGRVFSMQISPVMRGLIELEHVLPGEYWVLTGSGLIARARVDAARVAADVGTSSLTIRGAPGRNKLFVAPAEGNELVWLMANRVAQLRIPPSGELVVSPLPAGTYVVGAEKEGELGRIRITGEGAVLELE